MQFNRSVGHLAAAALALNLAVGSALYADPAGAAPAADVKPDVASEISALKARIADLERKENENWLTQERTDQIRSVVEQVLADAKTRGQFADGLDFGYKDGFYLQTSDQNFKLVIGGYAQFRYTYDYQRQASTKDSAPFKQGSQEDASGFEVRRARVNFSGNAFSPDLFYKLEGDFYGGSNLTNASLASTTTSTTSSGSSSGVQTASASGNFTVTDAFIGYRFNDMFKIRAGSFKVPFTKVELVPDPRLSLNERPEANTPFDAVRAIGISLFGDIQKDTLAYEVNINNGSNSNLLRRADTNNANTSGLANYNYDNRLGYYARVNWAGSGKVSEFFSSESDLRKDNQDFIWMLGAAGGYESQNSTNAAFTQNTAIIQGIGKNDGPGFASNYTLNGDLFRGTVDFSAKWKGWSLNSAAYFQQINGNPVAGTATTALPYPTKSSFFEHGYYAQIGYMVIPQKVELLGRVNYLLTEGDPNIGEYYTLGANYFLYGNNAKVTGDVTYSPEAAFTDTSDGSIQNTHEVIFRLQLQLAF